MIRAYSVCSFRVKFNIDIGLSEMRRLYKIHKFLCIHRGKEPGKVGKSPWNELWKIQVDETNFGKISLYMHQVCDV